MSKNMRNKVLQLLREMDDGQLDIEDINDSELHLSENAGFDSLDAIRFLLLVEEEFDIKIPEDDIDSKDLFKITNLVQYLENLSK